jgi:hypothetical protein
MDDLSQYDRWRTMPATMTPDEALTALRPLQSVTDLEVAHGQADEILCALLRHLGHNEIVEAWERVDKWYA